MNRNLSIAIAAILVVILCVSSIGVYTLLNKTSTSDPSPTPSVSPPETAPSPTESPSHSESPPPEPTGSVTVVDATGTEVTVQLPVARIVCLTSVENVYALGAGDKVVGITGMLTTDVKAILPSSILNLPTVGDADTAPNVEKIIELAPDLILSSQRLSDDNRKLFENAGIAVIKDSSTGDRRNQYLTNLGLILNAEKRVDELLAYEAKYWNLVKSRVADLPRSEKPIVYFEWYMDWFSTGPGGSYTKLIEAAGGIIVGENATVANPQLSAEVVMEQNPDVIIRMLDYTSGETLDSFKNLHNQMLSRSGVGTLNAAKDNQVYVIKSSLLVERDVVGLLYFAKWFHPDLFEDIDPAAVHAEMVEKYFGTAISGVYLYP